MALKRNGDSRASPPRLLRQLTTTRLSVPPAWTPGSAGVCDCGWCVQVGGYRGSYFARRLGWYDELGESRAKLEQGRDPSAQPWRNR